MQTISWIWWKSISGRTVRPTEAAGNRITASGRPLARHFSETQNRTVSRSARSKPSGRISPAVTRLQMPCRTPPLKAL
ncbi:hypothetical protein GCM10010430_40660 [Kitasatospora cystarginea]|uniref:Uncharacterized protein n=1 Tax=Kitasatospora cystarginea TaxID=58350 RepID=A0ABP5R6F5_9ACTN